MKYLIFGLLISTTALARDPFVTDYVRAITFDDTYKEMTVKLMEHKHDAYLVAEDSRAGKCLKNAYRGHIQVKVHLSENGDSIENCTMVPVDPDASVGNGGRPI